MRYCTQCRGIYPSGTQYCPSDAHPLETRDEFEVGSVVQGRYKVLEYIGSGNMADVFKVIDTGLDFGNVRAMKVPNARLASDSQNLLKFKDEANKAILLSHKYIVRSFHLDTTESGLPLLLMEFVDGITLDSWMNHPEARLTWRHAVEIAVQVAEALESAHADGVIHCDIKPANVKSVSKFSPTPLKVLDFGLGKATNVLLEKMGTADRGTVWGGETIAGTYEYMSPEQTIARDKIGPPSDIYSLGVVLYEMLTGSVPFAGIASVEQARRIHQDRRPDSLRGRPDLPTGLAALVESMLERPPDRRPSAPEVINRLTSLVTKYPSVREVVHQTETKRPAQKGRGILFSVAFVLLAVMVLGVFLMWPKQNDSLESSSTSMSSGTGSAQSIPTTETQPAPSPSNSLPDPNWSDRNGVGTTRETPGSGPKMAVFTISCNLACDWWFDGARQPSLEPGDAKSVNAPLGQHTVKVVASDGSGGPQTRTVFIDPNQANVIQFDFGPGRQQRISDGLARAQTKYDAHDDCGALSEYEEVVTLDPSNQTAAQMKKVVENEITDMRVSCGTK